MGCILKWKNNIDEWWIIQLNIIQDILIMSRYAEKSERTERKAHYRVKEEENKGRFGFEYIKANINYRTEIPPLPEKARQRPDEKVREKRIEELQEKIRGWKEERRERKERIREVNKCYDDQIEEIKGNVEVGKKCVQVLYNDEDFYTREINKVTNKIKREQARIEDLSADLSHLRPQNRPPRRSNKPLEEMNVRELDVEKAIIEQKLTLSDLSKKEEAELTDLLKKIGRVKAEAGAEATPRQESSEEVQRVQREIEESRAQLEKYRVEKGKYLASRDQIGWKIRCIREDIAGFIAEIKAVAAQEEESEEARKLYEEAKELKQRIYEAREQIAGAEREFEEKVKEFEYEQEKIRWIGWATKVQEEKREEWEAEKQERKKQKLREKGKDEKGGKGEKGGNKEEKGGKDEKGEKGVEKGEAPKEERREERRKVNRNQKEIDNCSFLIDYCKRLLPSNEEKAQRAAKKAVDVAEELKKGAWAKEKGVQVLQSKKARREEEEAPKYQRKREEPKEEELVEVGKFTHDYFVQKFFDNAKVIPPSSGEEVEKAIKELEDKLEYYLLHPDEGVESKFEQDRRYVDKTVRPLPDHKSTKSKPSSRLINTEDFPALP